MKEPVIERPELQSPIQRAMFTGLTATFWFIWIYIWLPFINLVAWAFGIKLWYDEMVVREGLHSLVILGSAYAIVILIMGSALVSWGMYNWARFHGKERRRYAPNVSVADAAKHFKVDAEQLPVWQDAQRMVVHTDENGQITMVDAAPLSLPPSHAAASRPVTTT